MARASAVRRLLRRLSFPDVRGINQFCELPPRKSKEQLVDQIVRYYERDIKRMVSGDGPYSLSRWNSLVKDFGGLPRKSFESVAAEIEAVIDPIFDDLDGDLRVSDLRGDKSALRILATKLRLDRESLIQQLDNVNGNTSLSTFVTNIRSLAVDEIAPQPVSTPAVSTVRLGSTRTIAPQVERLSLEWMERELADSDDVRIAAGFYDKDFIVRLLHGKPRIRSVKLLFNGLGGRRLREQVAELTGLAQTLEQLQVRVEIRLAFAPGMFHSKLFLFSRANGALRAVMGSANATNAAFDRNEEILISLARQTEPMERYFQAVWQDAKIMNSIDTSARNLVSFFRTGVLYFKPTESISFSLNPFRELIGLLSNDEKRKLGGIRLPHADIEAGIGPFSLRRAVITESADDKTQSSNQARIKPWSVETCYGYWVPDALIADWEQDVTAASSDKRLQLLRLRDGIDEVGEGVLFARYSEYIDAVREEFERVLDFRKFKSKLKRNPFQKDKQNFSVFHERVVRNLFDTEKIDRLSRPFVSGNVPEMWDDKVAYEDFASTFFDYVDQVSRRTKRPFVPGRILDRLDIQESEDGATLMGLFESYLEEHSWSDEDWERPGRKLASPP